MKLIDRTQYLNKLKRYVNTPEIKDAYPQFILARTRHEETDYEGVRIIDIANWLVL